jgi:multiple sugar transport system ATP-binding protein
MPTFAISGLTKRFGGTTALDALTFTAAAGEFVVVLGPTGAGKTTLLRTLAGLEAPDAGAVAEDGRDITRLPPAERDMAMVFQNFSLYPRLTVYENLAFPLKPKWRGIDKAEIDRRVRWAADLLGLAAKLQNMPTELSGGQQQRVAIGRAIVREPKLFLFDEPLASLDAKLRESMAVEIHRLQRRLGTTMLYVTHDQLEAMGLADRIVVLDRGRILQAGTPDDVYARPATPRVARMLGTPPVNLITPEQFAALFPDRQGAAPTSAATVGIRPEHLSVTPVAASSPAGARVKLVERLGPVTTIVVTWQQIDLRVTAGPGVEISPGAPVTVSVDAPRVLWWGF